MDPTSAFWTAVGLGSAVATAVATAAAVLVAAWWRRQDQQLADWAVYDGTSTWLERDRSSVRSTPYANAVLGNAGDGTGFRVRAEGIHCTVQMESMAQDPGGQFTGPWRDKMSVSPAMRPGDTVHLHIECDPRVWGVARMRITWMSSPTWKARRPRVLELALSDIAEKPVLRMYVRATHEHVPDLEGMQDVDPLPPELKAALDLPPPRRRWSLRRGS